MRTREMTGVAPNSLDVRLHRVGVTLAMAAMLATGLLAVPAGKASALAVVRLTKSHAVFGGATAAARLPGSLGWYSSNWAGYAVTAGSYRSVSGQWTVPSVSATGRARYSAQWVGLDGVSSEALIQTGTEADFYGGAPHYSAWWEILPAPAVTVSTLSVRPGDRITASIMRVSLGHWRITLKDGRSGTYSTTRAYAGTGTSAEWIEEAPVVDGRLAPLATHGIVVFDNATINGTSPHLTIDDGGAMLRRGVLVDTPSAPDSDGNGFALAQQGTPPASPGS